MTDLFRLKLVEEYELRRRRNPLYSKRAFARDVGIPASTLSEHMNHGTVLGTRNRTRVVEFLGRLGKLEADPVPEGGGTGGSSPGDVGTVNL